MLRAKYNSVETIRVRLLYFSTSTPWGIWRTQLLKCNLSILLFVAYTAWQGLPLFSSAFILKLMEFNLSSLRFIGGCSSFRNERILPPRQKRISVVNNFLMSNVSQNRVDNNYGTCLKRIPTSKLYHSRQQPPFPVSYHLERRQRTTYNLSLVSLQSQCISLNRF